MRSASVSFSFTKPPLESLSDISKVLFGRPVIYVDVEFRTRTILSSGTDMRRPPGENPTNVMASECPTSRLRSTASVSKSTLKASCRTS